MRHAANHLRNIAPRLKAITKPSRKKRDAKAKSQITNCKSQDDWYKSGNVHEKYCHFVLCILKFEFFRGRGRPRLLLPCRQTKRGQGRRLSRDAAADAGMLP